VAADGLVHDVLRKKAFGTVRSIVEKGPYLDGAPTDLRRL
jgi:hypothetical protein